MKDDSSVAELKKKIQNNKNTYQECIKIVQEGADRFVVVSTGSSTSINCTVSVEIPPKIGSKRAYIFMRIDAEKGDEDEEPTEDRLPEYNHMEISNKPLELLYKLTNEIFVPILHNPANQEGWTELISKDLMEKLNNYVA